MFPAMIDHVARTLPSRNRRRCPDYAQSRPLLPRFRTIKPILRSFIAVEVVAGHRLAEGKKSGQSRRDQTVFDTRCYFVIMVGRHFNQSSGLCSRRLVKLAHDQRHHLHPPPLPLQLCATLLGSTFTEHHHQHQ